MPATNLALGQIWDSLGCLLLTDFGGQGDSKMGTIEKRARLKNGEVFRDHGKPVFRWRAVVRMQGQTMSQTFDLKADAEGWIAEQERLIRRGQNPNATALSLADAIDRYEVEVSKRKK